MGTHVSFMFKGSYNPYIGGFKTFILRGFLEVPRVGNHRKSFFGSSQHFIPPRCSVYYRCLWVRTMPPDHWTRTFQRQSHSLRKDDRERRDRRTADLQGPMHRTFFFFEKKQWEVQKVAVQW